MVVTAEMQYHGQVVGWGREVIPIFATSEARGERKRAPAVVCGVISPQHNRMLL
jgi:hypothetical protein